MLKVGITGGIGTGKTTVCQVFETLGIPVFYADTAAKELMNTDTALRTAIINLFGKEVYNNGLLDNKRLSELVFNDSEKLSKLNAIVHPATIAYGKEWMEKQQAPYVIKEAAIFFESGSYKDMDVVIGIAAPLGLRIERAMQRAGATLEQVNARIAQQMDNDEKMKLCQYVLVNDEHEAILPQVIKLHHTFIEMAKG
ncbi:MAG: dephospho-CoA kinase [Taibaiella sp.]|nr:dephospho-CoA kinase [Taibaiella sp.]